MLIGSDADVDTQTDTCDYTACNGFTFKLDVFDKVETYGQCQFPAGENGSEDDYFCFVNKDSACKDKVIWCKNKHFQYYHCGSNCLFVTEST